MKFTIIKFHGYPSSGIRSGTCGQTDRRTGGLMDMTQLMDTFREYAKAPKTFKKKRFGKPILRWDNDIEINVAGSNVDSICMAADWVEWLL